tara:strand:- start:641 stop:2167 length:1527 start_codon:yes stop_codon:yes gene_type:complete
MIFAKYQILEIILIAVTVIYSSSLILFFLYSIVQISLLFNYLRKKTNKSNLLKWNFNKNSKIPSVTIQLPIYNELYVVERLLKSIEKIKYPNDKLEIQILDDSDDNSSKLISEISQKIRETGINIIHLRRNNRNGFKAGALREGMKTANGEFIAIFDSDFLPKPNFLLKTIPYFRNPKIGMIQTRWGFLNRNYSILTKTQAFALDSHFTLEQVGRNEKKHFINFNGTAGVWRKKTIIDSGDWQEDTLTEDLDLSYRAQLNNWEFLYLEKIITPSELPVTIGGIRSQQFRWNKGGAENFQKNISNVFKSKNVPFITKIHALAHLFNSTIFINIFLFSFLSIPLLYLKNKFSNIKWFFDISALFFVSTLAFYVCYWFVYKQKNKNGILDIIKYTINFIIFFSLSAAFSVHNSYAVIKGHMRMKTDFIRTPKYNLTNRKNKSLRQRRYFKNSLNFFTIVETAMAFYFLFGLYLAFVVSKEGDFSFFLFHLFLFLGYSYISFQSLYEKKFKF